MLWFSATLLSTPSCGFGRIKQRPLSELRERTGLAIRQRARDRPESVTLSKEEKKLVSDIASASEQRDWESAQMSFASYTGSCSPIYGAAIHAAFRCRKYNDGAKIYEQCLANCENITLPVFTVALRIFSKLGDATRVQQIWDQALITCELDGPLGSARFVAAAEAGNVELAAETLDQMNDSNVSIEVHHINSAMRACWGWGGKQHKAAKYFFDLLPKFGLHPTVISFTSLIGAYKTASLQDILSAYEEMKSFQIEPDGTFAETYIFSLLHSDHLGHMRFEKNLRGQSVDRLQAARDALSDFKQAGLRLPRVCAGVDSELARMGL